MTNMELCKKTYDHLEEVAPQVSHYFGILALFGGLKAAEASGDKEFLQRMVDQLAKFPDQIDHLRLGKYTFKSYTCGGIARAYALFKGYMTDDKTKELVRFYADELLYEAPKDRNGIVKSPFISPREVIWIDNAMAVTPFLLYAGLALNEPKYIDEAVAQTIKMYDVFLDEETGLLHQTKGEIAAGVISDDFWGRGNGWGIIALTELVHYLPADYPTRWMVEEYFGRHCHAMLMCQDFHYVWHQEMNDFDSYEEATATGLVLYAFGVGIRLNYLNPAAFQEGFEEGVRAMTKRFLNEKFEIINVCPGCRTPGNGREKGMHYSYVNRHPVTDDLHGAGPLMLTYSEAIKNGQP
ncbi:MAG: hypothetical protein E7329_12405 [Clostridiales bacterium]|nr:hypothetical protein [Clostridiales bacterium]